MTLALDRPAALSLSDLRHFAALRKARLTQVWRRLRPRRWAWRSAALGADLAIVHEETIDRFDEHRPAGISEERALGLFGRPPDWRLRVDRIERLTGDVRIEPGHAIAFLPDRRIFEMTRNVHREIEPAAVGPSAGQDVRHVPALIHFDGFLGANLWHFYCDCLGPLLMLRQSGAVDPDLPVLIHRKVWERPHVRFALSQPALGEVRWLVQEPGQWITTDCLFKADSGRDGWLRVRDALAPAPATLPKRRIFLDRRPSYRRRLTNDVEVRALLERRGFEPVFAEDLSYADQVRLFGETALLVAIHGAGISNILFAPPSLRMIEILSESYANPHYFWLSRTLGTAYYDAILGSRTDWRGNFAVDPATLDRALERMIAHEPGRDG